MRWWPILLVLAIAACGAGDERAAHVAPERDFTFQLPPGWHLYTESQTPALTNPVEILSAGTVRPTAGAERECAHIPVSALEAMGPDDAFVTVQERFGEPRFPPRPRPFRLPPKAGYTDAQACARNGDELDMHWFGFRDANRGFHVLAVFGRTAPPARRSEAVALLDSLRFDPGPEGVRIDPDAAILFEDSGLRWQMPVPPWRRYDSEPGRILLGTFDRSPEDGRQVPSGGALIEIVPRGELVPEVRMHLGDRASAALKRDARSILNSIQTLTERMPSGS